MAWRARLMGGLHVVQTNETGTEVVRVDRFRTRKAGLLLAYLCLNPNRDHSRDELIERFWGENTVENGRQSLRQALSGLRTAFGVGEAPLFITRNAARWNGTIAPTDVEEFRAAIQTARTTGTADAWDAAIALYTGTLLPGSFDDWVLSERERLEEAYLQSLDALCAVCLKTAQFARADDAASTALALAPLREETHQNRLRIALRRGETALAKRLYEELRTVMKRELGAEPGAKTRAVFDEPIPAPAVSPTPSVAPVPRWQNRFYGRERERTLLRQMLGDDANRLITVTGTGGIGKTRMVAEVLGADTEPAAFWVSLADIPAPGQVLPAIAAALGVSAREVSGTEAAVFAALRTRPRLVLDNLEQFLDAPDVNVLLQFLERLLQNVPSLQIITTSRRPLFLPGECEVALSSLALPPDSPADLVAGSDETAAIALFLDRARARRASFALHSDADAQAVTAICRRFDGLPLAIELAASWLDVLTPAQLEARLHRRDADALLTARGTGGTARHRRLRSVLESGLGFESPQMRRVFAALAVFRGGFSLRAAEAVLTEDMGDALVALATLRERSVLVTEADTATGELRYRLLEPLRELAEDYLREQDDAAHTHTLRRNHLLCYMARFRELVAHPPGTVFPFAAFEQELPQIENALTWAFTASEPVIADAEMIVQAILFRDGVAWHMMMRGKQMPSLLWLSSLWERRDRYAHDALATAHIHRVCAALAGSPAEARARLTIALTGFEQRGDTAIQAKIWESLGDSAASEGDLTEMERCKTQALSLTDPEKERDQYRWMMAGFAGCFTANRCYEKARPLLQTLRRINADEGHRNDLAKIEMALAFGYIHGQPPHYEYAQELLRGTLPIWVETGETRNHAEALRLLGEVQELLGHLADARETLAQSLLLYRQIGDATQIATIEEMLQRSNKQRLTYPH